MKTTLLTVHDIRQIVRRVGLDALMRQMIEALEASFRAYDPQTTTVPVRDGFAYDFPSAGLLEWMPVLRQGQAATIKVVGYHPHNPTLHEVPTIISSIGVYDVQTGQLSGLMDGTFLTALRTGAASAVASRRLARQDARIVGLIGAGAQAVTQLHALALLFPLERVLVYDRSPHAAASFKERAAFLGIPIELIEAQQRPDLLAQADIVCTVTSTDVGAPPVIEDGVTREWLHINAVGSDFPGKTELPRTLLERAFVCPDFLTQALKEGECQQLRPDQIGAPLHEVVKRESEFRHLQHTLTVFDSTGWAVEDAAAAQIMLDYATEFGIGQRIDLQHMPPDPLNPYDFS